MEMSPSIRKLNLTAHVISSVGWFGALAVFLAHSVVSVASQDLQVVRAACLAMGLTAWFVVLPFSLASLATGLLQALGTAWGLLRHYWVLVKLLLTLLATAVLLLKLPPISEVASAAAQALTFAPAEFVEVKTSLLVHAVGGLLVLAVTTALAIYKPQGTTTRGNRFLREQRGASAGPALDKARAPRWVKAFAVVGLLLVALGVLALLVGGHGPGAHGGHRWATP